MESTPILDVYIHFKSVKTTENYNTLFGFHSTSTDTTTRVTAATTEQGRTTTAMGTTGTEAVQTGTTTTEATPTDATTGVTTTEAASPTGTTATEAVQTGTATDATTTEAAPRRGCLSCRWHLYCSTRYLDGLCGCECLLQGLPRMSPRLRQPQSDRDHSHRLDTGTCHRRCHYRVARPTGTATVGQSKLVLPQMPPQLRQLPPYRDNSHRAIQTGTATDPTTTEAAASQRHHSHQWPSQLVLATDATTTEAAVPTGTATECHGVCTAQMPPQLRQPLRQGPQPQRPSTLVLPQWPSLPWPLVQFGTTASVAVQTGTATDGTTTEAASVDSGHLPQRPVPNWYWPLMAPQQFLSEPLPQLWWHLWQYQFGRPLWLLSNCRRGCHRCGGTCGSTSLDGLCGCCSCRRAASVVVATVAVPVWTASVAVVPV